MFSTSAGQGENRQSLGPCLRCYRLYSPNRKGAHPAGHWADFSGVMHADCYGGYKKLYGSQIVDAACMAHLRCKFHNVIKLKRSPMAEEVLSRIGGIPAAERQRLRQEHAGPVLTDLKVGIEETLPTLPQKQKLAEAMRHALSRWAALSVYIDDGRVEIDNNIAERAMRRLGIGRKNSYDHCLGFRRTSKGRSRSMQRKRRRYGRDGSERRDYSRLLKLLSWGWLPNGDDASEGCLDLAADVG